VRVRQTTAYAALVAPLEEREQRGSVSVGLGPKAADATAASFEYRSAVEAPLTQSGACSQLLESGNGAPTGRSAIIIRG